MIDCNFWSAMVKRVGGKENKRLETWVDVKTTQQVFGGQSKNSSHVPPDSTATQFVPVHWTSGAQFLQIVVKVV